MLSNLEIGAGCSTSPASLHILAKCWVNTGCVQRLKLLYIRLPAVPSSSQSEQTTPVDTLVRYSHCVADFQADASSLKHFSPSFLHLSFLSLQSISTCFWGSVVGSLSTHEQLKRHFWTWCDLSPLLPKPCPQVKVCILDFLWTQFKGRWCIFSGQPIRRSVQFSFGLKVVSCGVKLPVSVKKKLHSLRVKVVYIKDFLFITRNYSTWMWGGVTYPRTAFSFSLLLSETLSMKCLVIQRY